MRRLSEYEKILNDNNLESANAYLFGFFLGLILFGAAAVYIEFFV